MEKFIKGIGEKTFKKMTGTTIFLSIIMFFIGLIMFLVPEQVNNFVGYFIGGMCAITGLDTLYKFFFRQGAKLYSFNILFSVILISLGILIILTPNSITEFVVVIFGIYLIVKGAIKITYASWLKVGNDTSWSLTFFSGILLIFFGILMFINPFAAEQLTKILGIFIMLSNILDVVSTLMIKKRSSEIVKIFW